MKKDQAQLNSSHEKPQLFACEHCRGTGQLEQRVCRRCGGLGVIGQWKQISLRWGRGFDAPSVLRWEMGEGFFWLVNIILLFIAIGGLLSLLFALSASGFKYFLNINFWLDESLRLWWLSVLTNCFLYYRLVLHHRGKISLHDLHLDRENQVKEFKLADAVSRELWLVLKSMWQRSEREKLAVIKPIHLFQILLEAKTSQAILVRLGLNVAQVAEMAESLAAQERVVLAKKAEVAVAQATKEVLFSGFTIAVEHGLEQIEVQSVLQALLQNDPLIEEIFLELGKDQQSVAEIVRWFDIDRRLGERYKKFRRWAVLRPKTSMNRAMTAIATPILDQFSQDLTRMATYGYLDFCIGRQRERDELYRLIEGGAQAVVLVGPDGVGKSTIIGSLAESMITEEVPELLKDKRLVALSIPKLLAGATAPGMIEQRLLAVRDEIVRSGNIAIFIDDIHDLVGASGQGDAGLDASELVARIIEQQDFPVLATSNQVDHRRFIEGKALGTVLQAVTVKEPTPADALAMLQAKVGRMENKYKVYYSLNALKKIIELSRRYLHHQVLPQKAIQIMEEVAVYVKNTRGPNNMIYDEDVAKLLSEKTEIPLTQITQVESERLLNLEDIIHQRLINQEEAVKAVASALRRARTQLRDEQRPIVNLLFLGPTGVGKTELAKTVAATYFGNEHELVRLDMSEYQQTTAIARLLGSESNPSGGYLTESIKRKPYTVLLLDELEKAHPDILNIFLQVMDDGRLTDWSGSTIDFTNTIIIATSNAGTKFIQDEIQRGTELDTIKELLIRDKLKEYFRPEFLNRFDNIVVFRPLTREHIKQVAGLLLKKNSQRLEEKGIVLQVTDAALEELASAGFDPLFGARPMRRLIQDRVDDALARYLLTGQVGRRDTVVLDVNGQIKIKKATRI